MVVANILFDNYKPGGDYSAENLYIYIYTYCIVDDTITTTGRYIPRYRYDSGAHYFIHKGGRRIRRCAALHGRDQLTRARARAPLVVRIHNTQYTCVYVVRSTDIRARIGTHTYSVAAPSPRIATYTLARGPPTRAPPSARYALAVRVVHVGRTVSSRPTTTIVRGPK